jgi:hypothetical protein
MDDQIANREGGGMIPRPLWFRYRYSLKLLLLAFGVAILVIAAYAVGYHNGKLVGIYEAIRVNE